jgi:hypothetical protein
MLFSVAASSVPSQTGLVAYDIGCTSIPSVVPTAANPGGLATSNSETASNNNNGAQGGANHRRQQQGGAAGGNTGANNNGGATTTSNGGATTNNGASTANQGTHANPMNAVPAGNPNPISTPAASSLAACLAACQGNSACVAYTFVSGACKLFG